MFLLLFSLRTDLSALSGILLSELAKLAKPQNLMRRCLHWVRPNAPQLARCMSYEGRLLSDRETLERWCQRLQVQCTPDVEVPEGRKRTVDSVLTTALAPARSALGAGVCDTQVSQLETVEITRGWLGPVAGHASGYDSEVCLQIGRDSLGACCLASPALV